MRVGTSSFELAVLESAFCADSYKVRGDSRLEIACLCVNDATNDSQAWLLSQRVHHSTQPFGKF